MFDPALFKVTPDALKAQYIPRMRELFTKQAALPPEIYDLEDEELDAHPDFQAYMEAGRVVIEAFQRDGGTVEQWNNMIFGIRGNAPELAP